MYHNPDTSRTPIRLFELPNTLAGDAAVTIVIQCLVTWLIELALVNRDLLVGTVRPVGFVAEPPADRRLWRWFLLLDHPGPEPLAAPLAQPPARAALFLFKQLLRVLLVVFVSFCLLWPASVGILTAVGRRSGGDWEFSAVWAPQIFKLVFGGLLALITTPPFAFFWLVRCGWAVKRGELPDQTPNQIPDQIQDENL